MAPDINKAIVLKSLLNLSRSKRKRSSVTKLRSCNFVFETHRNEGACERAYRRRKLLQTMYFITTLHASVVRERSLWERERSSHWWTYIVNETFQPIDWLHNFRMTKETFKKLCGWLAPYIGKSDTKMRRCISVELRVGLLLWTLATNVEYRTIGHLFGVSRSSVCMIVKEVCEAIHEHLEERFVTLPDGDELYNVMYQFENKWGFPNCIGAVDGSHIPIIAPKENHTDYYNRKGFYSIILQATVDSSYLFRDTCIGWPGKVHDARVLANSELYRLGQNQQLFPNEKRTIEGTNVPAVILGDPAYPLLPWLMRPYAETARTTREQHRFNYILSRNRMVVENAFGRLKGRWRRLLKRMDFNVQSVPAVISACCILHNICEKEGDVFLEEWDLPRQAMHTSNAHREPEHDNADVASAEAIRDAFCRYFSANH